MQLDLSGVKLALLGGDAREVILAEHLARLGAQLKVFGLPVQGKNIYICDQPGEVLEGVQALVLPVPGVDENLRVYSAFKEKPFYLSEELLSRLSKGTLLFVGIAKPPLKRLAVKLGLRLIEVMEIDEVAILNSIPSAEGAVQLAMSKLPITIHGSRAWVLGFGRTGQTLSRLLAAMGAKTTVVARSPSQLARAYEMGLGTCTFKDLKKIAREVDVIFNTVPALVLDRDILELLPVNVLIIDLASAPGGTDFEHARKLGIEAILAPGLPGKVAPKTAGKILSQTVPRLLAEELTLL